MSNTEECRISHGDESRDSLSTDLTSSSSSQLLLCEAGLPENSQRRVDLATAGEGLSGSRCLIENTDEVNVVHYVHCLAMETKDHILDALEFSWGMPHQTLNLDTRYNVLHLSSKFHALYDKKLPMFVLLPEEHIIKQYFEARNNRTKFPEINEPSYKYTFLAHEDMASVPIHRLTTHGDLAAAPPAEAYTHFAYPYSTFDPVISHVHPQFVICDVGKKMHQRGGGALAFSRLHPNYALALEMSVAIWRAWTNVPNSQAFNAFKKEPDTSDNMSSTSERTARRRLFPSRKRLADKNESPRRGSKRSRKGRGQNDGIWLDDETLREHDSKVLPKGWKYKQTLISDWTKVVNKTGIAVEQAMDEACGIPVLF